jgi:uncharacterized protein YhaN
LEGGIPLPFVVDDVLVQFDDQRSAAALRILGQLSDRTQVLFFTHHDHLIAIAERETPPEKLFLHRLEATMTSPGTTPVG